MAESVFTRALSMWIFGPAREVVRMETLMTQVGNFGFPVVLSIYLLVRIEGKLDKLTESIQQLSQILGAVKGLKAQGH